MQKCHARKYERDLKTEFKSWANSRECEKVKTQGSRGSNLVQACIFQALFSILLDKFS